MSDSERPSSKSKRSKSDKSGSTKIKKEKHNKREKGEKSEKRHSKKRSIEKVDKSSEGEELALDSSISTPKQQIEEEGSNPKKARLEPISLSDLESIEYSIANISKHFELILQNTPDSSLEEEDCKDNEVYLRTKNPRIRLAQSIKSLYGKGKMAIIDDLKNGIISKVDHELSESGVGPSLRSADEYSKDKSRKVIKEYSCGSLWPPPLPEITDPALYKRVFTHKSFANKMYYLSRDELRQLHNERLEFLGDTILNSTISRLIYFRFPNMNEGDMTDVRSMLVSNDNIGKWALMYELDKQLKTTFDHSVTGANGEMDKPRPKIIADIFEAYIAGIYLDSSNGGEIAEQFLQSLAEPLLRVIEKKQKNEATLNTEAKNLLYVRIGSSAYRPEYHVVKQSVGNGDNFKVECRMGSDIIGEGEGPNIKEAGLRAAMAGLENSEMIEKYASIRRSMPRTAPVKAIHQLNKADGTVSEIVAEVDSKKTERLHSSSKDILYSMIGSSTLKPTYKSKFTEDRKYLVQVFMGDEQLGTGEGAIKKDAECQAADMALKNKALIDKWQSEREKTLKK